MTSAVTSGDDVAGRPAVPCTNYYNIPISFQDICKELTHSN